MTDERTPDESPRRCPRCGAPLVRAAVSRRLFGIPAGDSCVDCSDGVAVRQEPWACPACGLVVLLDPASR